MTASGVTDLDALPGALLAALDGPRALLTSPALLGGGGHALAPSSTAPSLRKETPWHSPDR